LNLFHLLWIAKKVSKFLFNAKFSVSDLFIEGSKGSDGVAEEALWICIRLERINEIDSPLCFLKIFRLENKPLRLKK